MTPKGKAPITITSSDQELVLAMPPALVFLFMLANDREVMGNLVSPLWANILATCVVVFLTLAGLLFGISVIAPKAFAFLGGG